jgi:excisionase family DNA binding protein
MAKVPTGCKSANGLAASLGTIAFELDLEALAARIASAILAHLKNRQEPTTCPPTALLLTPHQAAKVLCVCERTLWDLKEAGEIPVIRVGRATRYALSDLESWIARRRSRANALPGAPQQGSD